MIERFKHYKTTIAGIALAILPWLGFFLYPEFVGLLEIAEFYAVVFAVGGVLIKRVE